MIFLNEILIILLVFLWSEVYKIYDILFVNLANTAVGIYLEAHAESETNFSIESLDFGDKDIEAIKGKEIQ